MHMATPSRRDREKEEIQRRILDAARELFAADGYDSVTMKQIADRIEYTPTALYFHFRDKRDLFRRLCAEDFAKLGARFQVLARVPDPVERLRMLGRGYVAFALEHPHHYRLMFMDAPPAAGAEGEGAVSAALPREPYAFLLPAVTEAVGAERLRREFADPRLAAQTLWAGLHGIVALATTKQDDTASGWRPIEARTAAMLDALLDGMTSAGAAGARGRPGR
jgi:AcrR family transcriptional regulator